MNSNGPIKIFSGTVGLPLAREICAHLSVDMGDQNVGQYNDGIVFAEPKQNVRGCDTYVINPTNAPADNLQEVLAMARALSGSSASRVTIIIPYMGNARSDKKDKPRVGINARLEADQLSISGADRIVLVDLHADQIVGFFDPRLKIDHLHASLISIPHFLERLRNVNFVIASPDAGGAARAGRYADFLQADDFVIFYKVRPRPGEVDEKKTKIIGDVSGRTVVFVDDLIDTGGTMITDAKVAKEAGATYVICYATHGLFSLGALKRFAKSDVDEIVVTDTIPRELSFYKVRGVKVTRLPIAPMLAKAIRCLNQDQSLSRALFLKK